MNAQNLKVAIVYQAQQPPAVNGIIKPMKPGGYADSGADIAYTLKQAGETVITPATTPDVNNDLDWVFPDTAQGIQQARDLGANTIWLNTVLYATHPITGFLNRGLEVIGQNPKDVELYDDKWYTNDLLRKAGLPIPASALIDYDAFASGTIPLPFPFIAKPIRGRGSQGVVLIEDRDVYQNLVGDMFASDQYGTAVYIEAFLPGEEVTVTILPAGTYTIGQHTVEKKSPWCLPAVKRFNHDRGVAPYNGTVAIIHNSAVVSDAEDNDPKIQQLYQHCITAAGLVDLKAPIRIDCRADHTGTFYLFDLNMKPNMTGPSRPHRRDQDSLTALAARKIGWDFTALLQNMLHQRWHEQSAVR